jgi:hypothetical protein
MAFTRVLLMAAGLVLANVPSHAEPYLTIDAYARVIAAAAPNPTLSEEITVHEKALSLAPQAATLLRQNAGTVLHDGLCFAEGQANAFSTFSATAGYSTLKASAHAGVERERRGVIDTCLNPILDLGHQNTLYSGLGTAAVTVAAFDTLHFNFVNPSPIEVEARVWLGLDVTFDMHTGLVGGGLDEACSDAGANQIRPSVSLTSFVNGFANTLATDNCHLADRKIDFLLGSIFNRVLLTGFIDVVIPSHSPSLRLHSILDGRTAADLGIFDTIPEGETQYIWGFNASNTAEIAIQILTPGVFYSAESGTIYPSMLSSDFNPTAIPEPSTGALLLVGLVGMFARRPIRRSARR